MFMTRSRADWGMRGAVVLLALAVCDLACGCGADACTRALIGSPQPACFDPSMSAHGCLKFDAWVDGCPASDEDVNYCASATETPISLAAAAVAVVSGPVRKGPQCCYVVQPLGPGCG
jgi:hypothetical protein